MKHATLLAFAVVIAAGPLRGQANAETDKEPVPPPLFTVEVSWKHDTMHTSGPMGAVELHTTLEGVYEAVMREEPFTKGWGLAACTGWTVNLVKALEKGEPFCVRLRYTSGKLKNASGRSGREAAVFRELPAAPAQGKSAVLGNPDGTISSEDGKTIRIELTTVPGYEITNAVADEIFSCPENLSGLVTTAGKFRKLETVTDTSKPANDFPCNGTSVTTIKAVFKGSLDLAADLSATKRSVERGAVLTLDGSRSKGDTRRWTWTLKPQCAFGKEKQLEGRTVEVVLLCDTRVRLEVEDGKGRAGDGTVVTVRPRKWITAFEGGSPEYSDHLPPLTPLQPNLGANRCAIEGAGAETGHWIHHTADATWQGKDEGKDEGYEIAEVQSGPFKGIYYLSKNTLRIKRLPLVNLDLAPGSLLDQANTRKRTGKDFSTLREQVKNHEQLHSSLVKDRLAGVDPAPRIEELMGNSKSEVAEKADGIIRAAETELIQATKDERIKERQRKDPRFACTHSGRVYFRKSRDERAAETGGDVSTMGGTASLSDDDLKLFLIPCYAELGDETVQ